MGASASALGLIEGLSDGLAGAARLAGGALADDPRRRRVLAVGGYTTTAILSSLIGAATTVWQVGILRAGALVYHRLPKPGKLEIQPTKPLGSQRDLALAYSPGVAAACEAIVADPAQAAELTARANLVAVSGISVRDAGE